MNNYETIALHFDLPAETVLVKEVTLLARALEISCLIVLCTAALTIDLTYQLSDNKVLIVIADQGDITAQKLLS